MPPSVGALIAVVHDRVGKVASRSRPPWWRCSHHTASAGLLPASGGRVAGGSGHRVPDAGIGQLMVQVAFPGGRVEGEHHRPARRNCAGTSPIIRQSGKKKVVLARYVHNDRLVDALGRRAFCALRGSPGARAYYNRIRARGTGHHAALRQLGNRPGGILGRVPRASG